MPAVVAADQGSKWWAWHVAGSAVINAGGDVLVGPVVGSWFADPLIGTVLDVIDSVGLLLAFYVLVRRVRTPGWVLASELFLAGWTSNILDRLALHRWTAPGSRRGVVDFIKFGGETFNVADVCITVGAVALAVAACRQLLLGRRRDPLDSDALVEPNLDRTREIGLG